MLSPAGCDRAAHTRDAPAPWQRADRPDLEVGLVDPQGLPLPGGWVTLAPGSRDAATDQGGIAVFHGVAPGRYDATLAAPGHGTVVTTIDLPQTGGEVVVALEAVDTSTRLTGTVTDPYDQPVSGATITVDGVDVAQTGSDGTFAASGISEGKREVVARPPPQSHLRPWRSPEVELVEHGVVEVAWVLPGSPRPTASHIGSAPCAFCHADQASTFEDTAHARAGREPAELAADPSGIAAAFTGGTVVSLDPVVPAGTVTLAGSGDDWTAVVSDGLTATAALPVVHIYGGHRNGAAFAVDVDGEWAVLPVAWAAAGAGLSSLQHPAGFVPSWTDGWFDGTTLDVDDDVVSFDLNCAGCHTTGFALDDGGGFALVPATGVDVMERTVGCEACHGPGDRHRRTAADRRASILNPARLPGNERVEVCARCHERVAPDVHPFSPDPAYPVTAGGEGLWPTDMVADVATSDPQWWLAVDAARGRADQVGEFRSSPHRAGPDGWDGACEDCHDPHGSAHRASLRADPFDNALCTACHVSRFPDGASERAHSAHSFFAEQEWRPGTCTGCHMPRSGLSVRRDAVSGVGELHAHGLVVWRPEQVLAEFDAAGVDRLAQGEVPIPGCFDCHLQVDRLLRDADTFCPCPVGDPLYRVSYENLILSFEYLWGPP